MYYKPYEGAVWDINKRKGVFTKLDVQFTKSDIDL